MAIRDRQNPDLHFHGKVTADPAVADLREGDAWLRADLDPQELRAYLGGTVKILATSGGASAYSHGDLQGLLADDHPQYLNEARGDARYSALGHLHDDRYYTEAEIDAMRAMPFYKTDGVRDDVPLTAGGAVPFYKTDGALDPVPLVA